MEQVCIERIIMKNCSEAVCMEQYAWNGVHGAVCMERVGMEQNYYLGGSSVYEQCAAWSSVIQDSLYGAVCMLQCAWSSVHGAVCIENDVHGAVCITRKQFALSALERVCMERVFRSMCAWSNYYCVERCAWSSVVRVMHGSNAWNDVHGSE
jgi:hypothetical protein